MQMLLIRIGDVVYKGPRASFFMLHTNTTRKRLAGPTKKAEEVLQYVENFILLKRGGPCISLQRSTSIKYLYKKTFLKVLLGPKQRTDTTPTPFVWALHVMPV